MNILQTTFDESLKREVSLQRLGLRIIVARFKAAGIELTRSQQARLRTRLQAADKDLTLTVRLSDAQIAASTLTEEQRVSKILPLDLDPETYLDDILARIPDIVIDFIESSPDPILKSARRMAPRILAQLAADRRGFERRLARKWGRALNLLQMLWGISVEVGDDFNKEFRPEAVETNDLVFEVLTRLHARACQIGSEILTLLRSGHADGAHARWRSLHEIAVTGLFIESHGQEVAERYILHEAIESNRAARIYQEHCEALGAEPLSDKERAQTQSACDALIARFGAPFGTEYGWAAAALGKARPTFRDVERAAGLDRLRPYYKLASHNVHANPKGAYFRLGLLPGQQILLAGPSDMGLTEPGHGTAISLMQITNSLLVTRPNIDRLVICRVLLRLEQEVGDAFREVETR